MTNSTPERKIVKASSSAPQRSTTPPGLPAWGPRGVWRYGPLLLWMVLISFASTDEFSSINTSRFIGPFLLWLFPNLSDSRLAAIHFLMRKAGHFTEYAILAFFVRRALFASSREFIHRRWFELAILFIACYSLLDEFHQSFVPSRTASIYDCAIDTAGGLTVLLIFKLYDKARNKKRGLV